MAAAGNRLIIHIIRLINDIIWYCQLHPNDEYLLPKPQKSMTKKSHRCKANHLIIRCFSQIIVRASALLRFYRPCANNPPPTATVSPSLSAAVTEDVAGDHSASFALCLALCSTKRCVHMARATPPTAGVRAGSQFYRVILHGHDGDGVVCRNRPTAYLNK